jgi:hypothetical protein
MNDAGVRRNKVAAWGATPRGDAVRAAPMLTPAWLKEGVLANDDRFPERLADVSMMGGTRRVAWDRGFADTLTLILTRGPLWRRSRP